MTGETHQKINLIVIICVVSVLCLLVISYNFNIEIVKLLCIGLLLGYLFGPDLDQEGVTINEYELPLLLFNLIKKLKIKWLTNIFYHIKDILIKFNKILWYPYSCFPHRSIFTHVPPLCTILRFGYLNILLSILIQIPNGVITFNAIKLQLYNVYFIDYKSTLYILLGYTLIDLTHFTLDLLGSKVENRFKRRKIKRKNGLIQMGKVKL
jgi:uncharacterized metal-binding protein